MEIHEGKETHEIGTEDIIKSNEPFISKTSDPMTDIINYNL